MTFAIFFPFLRRTLRTPKRSIHERGKRAARSRLARSPLLTEIVIAAANRKADFHIRRRFWRCKARQAFEAPKAVQPIP
jgi:hypothetical protein